MPFPHIVELLQRRLARKEQNTGYEDMYDDPLSIGEQPGEIVGSVRINAVTIAPNVTRRVLDHLREHRADWIESLGREGKRVGEVRLVHDIIEVVVEKEHEAAHFVKDHEREIKVAGVASLVGTALAGSALVARHLHSRSRLNEPK
ncbi:MAG: hypothetical protein ACKVVP_18335 [Chloroflexota bacterium]